jgi:hypothetical protein
VAERIRSFVAAVIESAVVVSVIAEQHRDLLEALARGDPTAAERAMREHVVYLRDVVNAVEQSAPSNLSTDADIPQPRTLEEHRLAADIRRRQRFCLSFASRVSIRLPILSERSRRVPITRRIDSSPI